MVSLRTSRKRALVVEVAPLNYGIIIIGNNRESFSIALHMAIAGQTPLLLSDSLPTELSLRDECLAAGVEMLTVADSINITFDGKLSVVKIGGVIFTSQLVLVCKSVSTTSALPKAVDGLLRVLDNDKFTILATSRSWLVQESLLLSILSLTSLFALRKPTEASRSPHYEGERSEHLFSSTSSSCSHSPASSTSSGRSFFRSTHSRVHVM